MAPYEVLYEISDKRNYGVDVIRETEDKVKVIRDSLKAVSDWHKTYEDLMRKSIEFQLVNWVFVKVLMWEYNFSNYP